MLQLLKLLIQTQPLILRLLVQSRPLFGGEDPIKGSPWHHAKITWQAAEAAEWDVDGSSGGGQWDDEEGPVPDDSAAAAIAWHADYLDSYLYNPLWWATGGLTRFKAALLHQNDLIKLHFDDTTSTRQIQILWRRYLGGTVAGLLWAAERNDVDAARNIVGAGLHALQDFYSHSNWVDDPARRKETWVGVGPQVRDALHLYSGAYEHTLATQFKPHGQYAFDCTIMRRLVPAALMDAACSAISPLSQTPMCLRWNECKGAASPRPEFVAGVRIPPNVVYVEPPGIALDSEWMSKISVQQRDLPDRGQVTDEELGETLFEAAWNRAREHTTAWLRELDDRMAAKGYKAFWEQVKTKRRSGDRQIPGPPELATMLGRYNGDLEQWEEPRQTPFNFLTAGKYPPDPAGSHEGWYLRLDISTASEALAGTDADIYADVDGEPPFLLDRMHERVPQGGLDEFRLLEHNDFEAGSQDTYVVGPFSQRPKELALRNSAASAIDVVSGAWEDLTSLVSDILDDLAEYLLGLIAGKADYVGADKRTWSWDDLDRVLRTGPESFTLQMGTVSTPTEGKYDVGGTLSVEATSSGIRAHVTLKTLKCVAESTVDYGFTASDEPFVVWLVSSPALGDNGSRIQSRRTPPFEDVNTGDERAISLQEIVVDVPRYGGLIVAAQVWESDLESDAEREKLKANFASEFGGRTINERSKFLDALGRTIAPDWKVATLDAYAFLRGEEVEVAHLVTNRQVNQWVAAGQSLAVPLDSPVDRPVDGTDGLSLREIARRYLGITGGFTVVRDVFGVPQITGTQSLREKLKAIVR